MCARQFFLAASLILPLSACADSGQGPAHPSTPPAVNRELLVGTWAATSELQLVQQMQFNKDNSLKTIFRDVSEPVAGKYSWVDDRSITIEYQPSPSAKKAFQLVAKRMRQDAVKRVKSRLGPEGAEKAAEMVPLELPAGETLQIGLAERQLILTTEKKLNLSFDRK
jgi:hypothetical protein